MSDNPSWAEMEEEIAEESLRKRYAAGPITIEMQKFHPAEQRELVGRAGAFAERVVQRLQARFHELLDAWQREHSPISRDMSAYIREQGMDKPTLRIYDAQTGATCLQKYGYRDNFLKNDDLVIVFDLPKPVSAYWWKGRKLIDKAKEKQAVGGMAIEWGALYDEMLDDLWAEVGREQCEGELSFSRVNDTGEHKSLEFYYIWIARQRPAMKRHAA